MLKGLINKKGFQVALLIGIFAAFAVFIYSNIEYIKETLRIDPGMLLILLVVSVLNRVVNGLKIKAVVGFFGIKLTFWEWFGSASIINFYNYFISKSGSAAVAVYFKKRHKLEYSRTLSLFMGDVLVAFFVAGILGMICSLYGYFTGTFGDLIMAAGFCALAIGTLFLILMPEIRIRGNNWFLSKVNNVLHGWNLLRKNLKMVVILFFLNFMIMFIFALRYYIVFRLFSNAVPLFMCLIIAPLSVIVQFTSIIPGAYGLREVVAGFVTKIAALGFVPGAMATIVDRMIMMFTAFILGTISSYKLLNGTKGVEQEGGISE